MRVVATALLLTVLAASTANAQLGFIPIGPIWSTGGDSVACQVKRVTVLAQNKADCLKIGGKMLRAKQADAAQ
jgi:hypothetical protein